MNIELIIQKFTLIAWLTLITILFLTSSTNVYLQAQEQRNVLHCNLDLCTTPTNNGSLTTTKNLGLFKALPLN
jgi:hypothetical protein